MINRDAIVLGAVLALCLGACSSDDSKGSDEGSPVSAAEDGAAAAAGVAQSAGAEGGGTGAEGGGASGAVGGEGQGATGAEPGPAAGDGEGVAGDTGGGAGEAGDSTAGGDNAGAAGAAGAGQGAGGNSGGTAGGDDGPTQVDDELCPVITEDADCDTSKRPIVFWHGGSGSGFDITNIAQLFASNGFCAERFVAIDFSTVGGDIAVSQAMLDAAVNDVLDKTGFDKVDLMGRMNPTSPIYGGEGYNYLLDPEHAAKVAHYVHMSGSPPEAGPPDPNVPSLSISSPDDAIAGPVGFEEGPNAHAAVIPGVDHYGINAADEIFVPIYEFLYDGEQPQYTEIQCGNPVILAGKAQSFGDNTPLVGGKVEIYELGDSPRERDEPVATLDVAEDGSVGPFAAKRHQMYEFKIIAPPGDSRLSQHQYRMPFVRTDLLLRFLFPSLGLSSIVSDSVTLGEEHAALIVRYTRGGFWSDRDSLQIDGHEVLTDALADRSLSTVALFLFDDNSNGRTDGGVIPAYEWLPFLMGTDVFMQASTPAFIEVTADLNYRQATLKIPNWPSASEGASQVIFQ